MKNVYQQLVDKLSPDALADYAIEICKRMSCSMSRDETTLHSEKA